MPAFPFTSLKSKKILLLCHEHADLDSFCSAVIFQRLLAQKKIHATIAVPAHINEQALRFAQQEHITFEKTPVLDSFDTIIIFDFNEYTQSGKLRAPLEALNRNKTNVVVFDHHIVEKNSIDISKKFIKKAFSTTQVLFSLFEKQFDKKCFFYAALGMLEDTGHFLVGDKKLFEDFSVCLEKSGAPYEKLLLLSKHHVPRDERVAFLKAAQRSEITEINGTIIATSTVSFYQSQAAVKLLDFGADIALVAGIDEKTKETVLSARADAVFKREHEFNLVKDLLAPLATNLGGEYGGHSGAAQWKGNGEPKTVLELCKTILRERFLK